MKVMYKSSGKASKVSLSLDLKPEDIESILGNLQDVFIEDITDHVQQFLAKATRVSISLGSESRRC